MLSILATCAQLKVLYYNDLKFSDRKVRLHQIRLVRVLTVCNCVRIFGTHYTLFNFQANYNIFVYVRIFSIFTVYILNRHVPWRAIASLNACRSGSPLVTMLSADGNRGNGLSILDDGECLTMPEGILDRGGGFLPQRKANKSSRRMFLRLFLTHEIMSLVRRCLPVWTPRSTQCRAVSTESVQNEKENSSEKPTRWVSDDH